MKLRIKFAKSGCMKFIGHLDIMRYFQKAIRRAGIDIAYSEGFSPHQIMSFAAPLGVGLESEGEYLDIQVNTVSSSRQMAAKLNQVMTEGMRVRSVRRLPEDGKNAMSIVAAADYRLRFYEGCSPETQQAFREFMEQEELPVLKKTKKSEILLNIRPLIYDFRINGEEIFLKLATGSVHNLKPELVMETFFAWMGRAWDPFSCQICRMELYAWKTDGHAPADADILECGPVQEDSFISLEELGEMIDDSDNIDIDDGIE